VSNAGEDGYKRYVRFLKQVWGCLFLLSLFICCSQRIIAGDMVQTVPSHRVAVRTPAHPLNVWRHMRRISPTSTYSFYVECAHGITLVGASPELLVSVQRGGEVETHPIAGTRRRGADAGADRLLEADLLADEKERAEHIMLVDLGRNDLNRVCDPASVHVPRLMKVDYFSHVMHIVSVVRGRLREECTPLDAFRSVFPAGTVSGAPKLMAIEHIYTLERERRGLYAGAVGYFDLSGQNVDTCIAIRTLLWMGDVCYAQAGGGIVLDSDEDAEYQETVTKASPPLLVRTFSRNLCALLSNFLHLKFSPPIEHFSRQTICLSF
jgi:anthranilate synthase component 1